MARSDSSVVLCALTPWSYTRSPRLWSSARSHRGPLRAHFVCDPLSLHPVVLYALTSYVVLCALAPWSSMRSRCLWSSGPSTRGSLRARPVVLYALTLSMVLWAFNPWPSYALTSYVVLCALTPWCYTRSPRMWSSARSARAHLFHADLLHDITFITVCISALYTYP